MGAVAIPNEQLTREIVEEGGLREFCGLAWPIIEPGKFVSNWHVDAICDHLEAVSRYEIRRLVINMPPGCMKSLSVSVMWPAWEWITRPESKFIFTSYADSNVRRDATRMREIIQSEWYRLMWPDAGQLKSDQTSMLYFTNTVGGFRGSYSVRGQITGKHANHQVVDDPFKPSELTGTTAVANSTLDWVSEWWRSTMPTRLLKDGTRTIMMQRLHERELAGEMIEEGYTHLNLPMRYETDRKCQVYINEELFFEDPRQEEGDLLWPEMFPLERVEEMEEDMGPTVAAAQYQQRPSPAGGGIFKQDTFRYHNLDLRQVPMTTLCLSWDCTFKDAQTSDYVCGQVWCAMGANFFLVDQFHEKVGFKGTCDAIRTQYAQNPRVVAVLVEDKANGSAVIETLKDEIPGMVAINPMGGKASRAHAVEPLFASGNVYFPDPAKHPWVKDMEHELTSFPTGRHDDRVDALTQALVYLRKRGVSRYVQAMKQIKARQ